MRNVSMMAAALAVGLCGAAASAQTTVFQRATLGQTGITSGGGLAVSNWFYTGWRFEVTNGPLTTTRIGGHFFAGGGAPAFGVIVRLTGPNDDPDDRDNLASPDVLGHVLINMPTGASNEVSANFNVPLQNGWYVVLFGGGLFNAVTNPASLVAQDPSTAVPLVQPNITYRTAISPFGPGGPFLQGNVCRVFVEAQRQAPTCRPDLNNDGELTFDDIQLFVSLYNANDNRADFNNDGEWTFDDIQLFIAAYNAGC